MRRVLLRHRRLFYALILLALVGSAVFAQPAGEAVEPTDIGQLSKRTAPNQFQPLELMNAVRQSDIAIFNQLTYFTIPGKRSPVRFRKGEPVELYLRIFIDSSDPRAAFFPVKDPNQFQLHRTEEDGDNRRVLLASEGFDYSKAYAGRPLLARLFGQASFVLLPTEGLAPGEYAVKYSIPGESCEYRLFCFGVDDR